MADIESAPQITFTVASKRPHEDDNEPTVSTPKKVTVISDVDSPLSALSSIASPSPLKVSRAPAGTTTSTTAPQPVKRRKLTPLEKEQQRQEKEANDKAREEKKAQKEAEEKLKAEQKAQRDEEKRAKDEEKRKKAEEREDKKRAKEIEQQKKEEEKLKKNRQQLRLNNFFVKKDAGADAGGVGNALVDVNQNSTPAELVAVDTNTCPVSPQKLRVQKAKSAYDGYFFPFQLPSHAMMAPYNHYAEDPTRIADAESRLQKLIAQEDVEMGPMTIESIRSKFTAYAGRGIQMSSLAEIVNRINSSSDNPVDLTHGDDDSRDPLQLLKGIPMKYLHFGEDVRPPYWGTYTKPHSKREALKLARNPISRTLRETDYDYDSEAEWEELEGEDLGSDEDDDMDDEADDDMDGFLDDENDPLLKRRHITTDNEPVSTGLCWEDAEGVSRLNDGSDAISTEFKAYKMGFLLDPQPQSIDPFSTAYWAPDPAPVTAASSRDGSILGLMQPPRIPLTQRPANGMLNTLNSSASGVTAGIVSTPVKPRKRMIPSEHLPAFKAAVQGSDLTKIALIESLKKQFPKIPKDAISNTLKEIAQRLGAKEAEKRWVLTK